MQNKTVSIVGAGLAGSEAAVIIANHGIKVELYEMKPEKKSPAHTSNLFAELVCSNSLRAERIDSATGLLKHEMKALGSIVIEAAQAARVPAGGALAVDRDGFSAFITNKIKTHPNITVINKEIVDIQKLCENGIVIIATGPLTSDALAKDIQKIMGESLYFYDAAAPIVTAESIDFSKVFKASRYNRGDDYLNCPMTKQQYYEFYNELISAQTAKLQAFETLKVFEGCMPIEAMAKRGETTICFGPLKPVGLVDPKTNKEAFATVQLRQENEQATLYNIVGFQTNLKFNEQKRVFGLIPGLENAEFARYGVMHRNTFIQSPKKLDNTYNLLENKNIFFAGQITGVEGYCESASSGIVCGIAVVSKIFKRPFSGFSKQTAIGALSNYISTYNGADFQPMNVNFGIIESVEGRFRKKTDRYSAIADRALDYIEQWADLYL